MICPRDCFFCLKRILIFIYNIYNTYYKNIYIIYSIYTSVILEFWIGFLPSGLTRWPSGCRDGIRHEARRHNLSSVSTERGRSWFSSIGFDTMAFGLVRRDSVRSPSAYSELGLNRARAKLVLCHQVWPDGPRVGRWANGEKRNGRVRRHGDVCELADGTLCLPKQ